MIVAAGQTATASSNVEPWWVTPSLALLAILGTLAGVIITNAVNGKHERARQAHEDKLEAQRDRARIRDLLYESKKVAFAYVLRLADERLLDMQEPFFLAYDKVTERQTFNVFPQEWLSHWRDMRAEVTLLDSNLAALMQEALDQFVSWGEEIGYHYIDNGMAHLHKITEAMTALQKAMLTSLGTTPS